MNKVQCSACNYCGQEESNIHLEYCCPVIKRVTTWLGNMLKRYCDMNNVNFMKILFLELPQLEKRKKNICLLIISTYILCLWNLKDNRSNAQSVIQHMKGKVVQKNLYLKSAFCDKYMDMVTDKFYDLKWYDL